MFEKESPVWEKTAFLSILTILGGFMNAYTYVTRDGVFANMHTSNMSKLGIGLAESDWTKALTAGLMILSCIIGAAFSECVKTVCGSLAKKGKYKGDWRKAALAVEALILFIIGCAPPEFNSDVVLYSVAVITGFQLGLFRSWYGSAHNTTICTGNIRNVGSNLFNAVYKHDHASVKKFLFYFWLVFSFVLGNFIGTFLSQWLGCKAVWCGSLTAIACLIIVARYEKTHPAEKA